MWRSHQRNWLHFLAATVGYARVRSRAHYLSDVLAGGILGYTIGRCADLTCTVLMRRNVFASRPREVQHLLH